MRRAWTVNNVLNAKFEGMPFTGEWERVFGHPMRTGSWTIHGHSGSGKTTGCFQLANYLSQFERVLYNALEEKGLSSTIQNTYNRIGMDGNNISLVYENMQELANRLRKHKSPNIVFIDSIKYTRLRNFNQHQAFVDEFPKKLFIWVGHAKGKEIKGALAEDIYYDSHVKIYIEGYRMFVISRYSQDAESSFDIWTKGAKNYWGEAI